MQEKPQEALRRVLQIQNEVLDIECKRGGSIDDVPGCIGVVRGMMGMANTSGGGWLILGIEQANGLKAVGCDAASSWTHDAVSKYIQKYASSDIEFHAYQETQADIHLVVIRVEEFRVTPVVCKKTYFAPKDTKQRDALIRKGAAYVRGHSPPRTYDAIESTPALEDLLDMATRKRVVRFAETAASAGLKWQAKETEQKQQLQDFLNG